LLGQCRYVNHGFNSNCLKTVYDFEIAIRDIQVGKQLTDDYGHLKIPVPFRRIKIRPQTEEKTSIPALLRSLISKAISMQAARGFRLTIFRMLLFSLVLPGIERLSGNRLK